MWRHQEVLRPWRGRFAYKNLLSKYVQILIVTLRLLVPPTSVRHCGDPVMDELIPQTWSCEDQQPRPCLTLEIIMSEHSLELSVTSSIFADSISNQSRSVGENA